MLKQKDIDTGRKLKALHLPITQIAEITGLTVEQIDALYNDLLFAGKGTNNY